MADAPTIKVLFLCAGSSCRSQMAEGWARKLKGERIAPYSAGVPARGAATQEQALAGYRRVRDEIRAFVESLPEVLP